MKTSAKKAMEKDVAKGSATRQPPTPQPPRKRPCTGKKVTDEEEVTSKDKKQAGEEERVWLDSDAPSIHCNICFMPFDDKVFMCINGHAACEACCARLQRKCSLCKAAIGNLRCRPAEQMLAEMKTLCQFSDNGCGELIKFVERQKHEGSCRHAPYGCPVNGCSYRGMNTGLYEHALDEHAREVTVASYLEATTVTLHKSTPFRLLVQADMRKLFLLLNAGVTPAAGRSLSLVCLGPRPDGNVDIKYKMEVRGSDGDGGELSLKGTAPCIREHEGFEANKFLFVPDAYWGPSNSVSVSVHPGPCCR